MKALLSSILAVLILFFSLGFKVSTHYCGDTIVESKLTLTGKAESCGMDVDASSSCENEKGISIAKKNCCSDEEVKLVIEDDYYQNDLVKNAINIPFLQSFIYVRFTPIFDIESEIHFKEHSPPLVQQNILLENQVFLI